MGTGIAFGPYNVIIMRSITDRVTRAKLVNYALLITLNVYARRMFMYMYISVINSRRVQPVRVCVRACVRGLI